MKLLRSSSVASRNKHGMRMCSILVLGLFAVGVSAQEAPNKPVAVSDKGTISTLPSTDAALDAVVRKRYSGDYSGLCVMVATIGKTVARATVCADPARAQVLGANSTFEIGSIGKTMTAMLVADLINQGKMALDDPIEKHLPKGSVVPTWEGKKITVQHIVTHTSGLPRLPSNLMKDADPNDPYAKPTPESFLKGLSQEKLLTAPGTKFAYSNYAMMLMSLAVTQVSGQDFPVLMQQKLFTPLGMKTAHYGATPAAAKAVLGHTISRKTVPAWNAHANLSGLGQVRASLDDMVAYTQASLGQTPTAHAEASRVARLIETAQKQLHSEPNQTTNIGMNWFHRTLRGGNKLIEHSGGTAGFTSYLAIDRTAGQAVIILADTGNASISKFGDSLIDNQTDGGKALVFVPIDATMLAQMVGDYFINGDLPVTLRARDGKLFSQAQGQPEFALNMASDGMLILDGIDIKVKPHKEADGYRFTLFQGGGEFPVTRTRPAEFIVPASKLLEYEGMYPMWSGMKLKVFVEKEKLMGQGTGQGAFPLRAAAEDEFKFSGAGINLKFIRDAAGKVSKLDYQQGSTKVIVDKE